MEVTIAIIIYSLIGLYAVYKSYSTGLENGYKLAKGKEVQVVKEKAKPIVIPPEEEKYLDDLQKSWSNIDNYNGTNIGQVDIN